VPTASPPAGQERVAGLAYPAAGTRWAGGGSCTDCGRPAAGVDETGGGRVGPGEEVAVCAGVRLSGGGAACRGGRWTGSTTQGAATVASESTRKALRDGPRGPRLGLVATAHGITHPLREPRPTPAPLLCPVRLGFQTSLPIFSRRADSGRGVRALRPMFTIRVSLLQTCVPKVSFIDAIWKVPLGS